MNQLYILNAFLFLTFSGFSQAWEEVYDFEIEQDFQHRQRVDVSEYNHIVAYHFQSNFPFPDELFFGLTLSTDGGASWTELWPNAKPLDVRFDNLGGLYFTGKLDASVGDLIDNDTIYYSTDLGITWQNLEPFAFSGLNEENFYLDADNRYYAMSNDTNDDLYRQMSVYLNGELQEQIVTPQDIFQDSMRGLCKTTNGRYLYSTYNSGVFISDNGVSYAESPGNDDLGNITFTYFAQANNGDIFLAGPSLRKSPDNGDSWLVTSLTSPFVDRVLKAPNGVLLTGSKLNGMFYSVDDGATWSENVAWPGEDFNGFTDMVVSDTHVYIQYARKIYRMPLPNGMNISNESLHSDWKIWQQNEHIILEATDHQNTQAIFTNALGQQTYISLKGSKTVLSASTIGKGLQIVHLARQDGSILEAKKIIVR